MSLSPYAIPYHFHGRDYTIDVYASDAEDARARIRSAFYQGNEPQEIVAQVTAPAWLGKIMGAK